jgi:hypothetical protein
MTGGSTAGLFNIYDKLLVHSRSEVVVKALLNRLLCFSYLRMR